MKIDYAKETGHSSAVSIAEFQTSEGLSTKEFFERNSKTLDTNEMYDPDEAERWRKALIEGKFPDDYEPVIKDEDIVESDTWEDIDKDQYAMVDLIDKLQTENTDLKHAVEYYEKYVKWLEENYIFILRSPKSLKEDFDKLMGGKDNE